MTKESAKDERESFMPQYVAQTPMKWRYAARPALPRD